MPETIIAEGKYDEMVAVFMIYLRRESKKKYAHTPQQQNTHREREWMNARKTFDSVCNANAVHLCVVYGDFRMHNAQCTYKTKWVFAHFSVEYRLYGG